MLGAKPLKGELWAIATAGPGAVATVDSGGGKATGIVAVVEAHGVDVGASREPIPPTPVEGEEEAPVFL